MSTHSVTLGSGDFIVDKARPTCQAPPNHPSDARWLAACSPPPHSSNWTPAATFHCSPSVYFISHSVLGTMSLKNIAISLVISCSAIHTAFGHPHCHYDQREVDLERELTFCPMDYADVGVCCTAEEEAALEVTFTAASNLTTECADYYQQVSQRVT